MTESFIITLYHSVENLLNNKSNILYGIIIEVVAGASDVITHDAITLSDVVRIV